MPQSLLEGIKRVGEERKSTLFMMLLTSFVILLYRYSKNEDIVVGSPIANRNYSEIENLLGCFVNLLVLRIDCSQNLSFENLLNEVKNVTLDAYKHQDMPFEQLVDALQIERNLSYHPLCQVIFLLQNVEDFSLEFDGLEVVSRVIVEFCV